MVETSLCNKNGENSSSDTLLSLIESGVKRGDGSKCKLRGPTRRRTNQMMLNTISTQTLKLGLGWRTEQLWACPTCH